VVQAIAQRMGKTLADVVTAVDERLGQDAAYVIDSTRARTELGWSPQIELVAGIDEVIRWVEEYWEEIRLQPLDYQHRP
nr:hypothetical protein [Candidatus Anammoximicrobium sp.]